MYGRNMAMLLSGYAPSKDLAKALNKSNPTIHNMVEDGRFLGARDGRALYVLISSVIDYYEKSGARSIAERMLALQVRLTEEAVKNSSAA